jgi:hypothetical protein
VTIASSPKKVGSKRQSSKPAQKFVRCPACKKKFGTITITHVRTHGITMKQFRAKWPNAQFEAPARIAARTAKASTTLRQRIQTDPAYKRFWTRHGQKLAAYRRKLTPRQNAILQQRSTKTFLATTTFRQRSEHGKATYAATLAKHPDLCSRGGKEGGKFWKTLAGRRLKSKQTKRLWRDPKFRKRVSKANSKAAINGRIPVRFNKSRPTTLEKQMIGLLAKWTMPFRYTGEGSFRIPIANGHRNWRNPDFIHTKGIKAALLLDSYVTAQQAQETQEYETVGWTVIRVSTAEMADEKWLKRKLTKFLRGLPSIASK